MDRAKRTRPLEGGIDRRGALRTIGGVGLSSVVAFGEVPVARADHGGGIPTLKRPPSIAWERTPGGVGAYVETVTVARDGGYVFGAGNRLTKLDPDGSTEWERSYDVGLVEAIATTDDGYVLAAQSTRSSAVLAVDDDGDPRWRTVIDDPDGNGRDRRPRRDVISIPGGIVDQGGAVVVAGTVVDVEGYDKGYVARLASGGELRWYTVVERDRRSVGLSDVASANGGYVAAGNVHHGDRQSPLFVRVDDGGEIDRERLFDDRSGIAFALVRAHDGGYVLGGATLDEADDAFLLRVDREGEPCRYCRYGESDVAERLRDLVAVDGGYAFGGNRLRGAGGDGWIGRVDTALRLSWVETYGSGQSDGVRTLVADEGGLAFGGATTVNRTGRGWVVRLTADD